MAGLSLWSRVAPANASAEEFPQISWENSDARKAIDKYKRFSCSTMQRLLVHRL